MRRSHVWRMWGVFALLLSACAHTRWVQAPATLPARVPVHVFPSVWVAGGDNQEEIYLLDRIASYLARDSRREVRRVDAAELEPARQAGQISWLTGVVRLKMGFRADTRTVQSGMPMQYCGMFGCSVMAYQSYFTVVPVLHGDAVLSVYEGPTARELSRETFTETIDGDRSDEARAEVVERLADDLLRAVDLHIGRERFRVQESRIKQADLGVRALSRAKFAEAKTQLEAARAQLGGHKRETQARVWHALGVARILAQQPKDPSEQDFADAERALRLAYQLAPSDLRRETLEDVIAWHKQYQVLREQQYAAEHNFALAKETAGGAREVPVMAPNVAPPAPSSAAPPAPANAAPLAPAAPPGALPSAPAAPTTGSPQSR